MQWLTNGGESMDTTKKQTKTKPLLQCSAKYISGICYDGQGLATFLKNKQSVVSEYAYILHDRDVNEDGTPKRSHYHFLLVLHFE